MSFKGTNVDTSVQNDQKVLHKELFWSSIKRQILQWLKGHSRDIFGMLEAMKSTKITVDQHLSLRPLVPSDADLRYALLSSNRGASRWLPWITDANGPDPEYLEQNTLVPIAGSRTVFGIFRDSTLVGQIEFDPQDESAETGTGSIGYLLDEKTRGQGIATRACAAVISYAFDEMKLKGIEIHCRLGNLPSIKVAKRLGFQGGEPDDRVDGQLLFTMTPKIWFSARH